MINNKSKRKVLIEQIAWHCAKYKGNIDKWGYIFITR